VTRIWFDGGMRRALTVRSLSLFAVLFGALALVGTPAASSAATACTPLDAASAAQQADAVFTGVLAGAGQTDDTVTPKRFTYPVTVQQSLKGDATGQVTVITRGGACGIGRLQAGAPYLFFVNAHGQSWLAPGSLGTTATGVDTLVPQVEAALAPPTVAFGDPLIGKPASLKRIAAPGVALVLIGLLGLLFVRRSPRPQA
jgi:hypothetical protein